MSAPFIPIDGHHHLFQKSAQKLFAIPIRGGWRSPDFVQIGTKRENFLFLFFARHARALSFPSFEFGLGSGEIAQAPFPLGFESAWPPVCSRAPRHDIDVRLVQLRSERVPLPDAID